MNRHDRARTRRPSDGDFHVAFAAAVAAKGTTLKALQRRLAQRGTPVSLATLSYWKSGRSQPERPGSLDAVAEIEALLGLRAGALASRRGPSRRRGPAVTTADVPDVVADQATVVQEALDALGLAGADHFADDTLHVVLEVDAGGRVRVITIRGIWRALTDGACRMPLIYVNDRPILAMPEISGHGGRLGRDVSRPEHGLVAREFVVERPLRTGEEVVLEQRTEWADDLEDQSYEHYLVRKVHELVLWVRFHPDRLPSAAQSYTIVDGERTVHELDVDGVSAIHLVLRRFGPGSAGISWTW